MNLLKYHSYAILVDDEKVISKVNKIIDVIKSKGHKVACINKDKNNIINTENYESLKDISYNIDIVIITSFTLKTYEILDEMELLDIDNIWFEKGSYNEVMMKKVKELKLNASYDLDLCSEITNH